MAVDALKHATLGLTGEPLVVTVPAAYCGIFSTFPLYVAAPLVPVVVSVKIGA
jgi:hypothetical protein